MLRSSRGHPEGAPRGVRVKDTPGSYGLRRVSGGAPPALNGERWGPIVEQGSLGLGRAPETKPIKRPFIAVLILLRQGQL